MQNGQPVAAGPALPAAQFSQNDFIRSGEKLPAGTQTRKTVFPADSKCLIAAIAPCK